MNTTTEESLKEQAKEAYREARPWVKVMARLGYASKGIVYLTVGLLVLRAIVGLGSASVDTRDALLAIEQAPLGQLLLALLAAGLVGYVLWRFVQAIVDPENRGTNLKGLAKRATYIVSGLSYAGLVLLAIQMVIGAPASGNKRSPEDWAALLLARPYGQELVMLIGAAVLALGLYQFYLAATAVFKKKLEGQKMSRLEWFGTLASGRLGFISRGVLICTLGLFVIQAAVTYNPERAAGMGEALLTLALTPFGPWLLGGLGIGFVAFGVYILLLARFGRYEV